MTGKLLAWRYCGKSSSYLDIPANDVWTNWRRKATRECFGSSAAECRNIPKCQLKSCDCDSVSLSMATRRNPNRKRGRRAVSAVMDGFALLRICSRLLIFIHVRFHEVFSAHRQQFPVSPWNPRSTWRWFIPHSVDCDYCWLTRADSLIVVHSFQESHRRRPSRAI